MSKNQLKKLKKKENGKAPMVHQGPSPLGPALTLEPPSGTRDVYPEDMRFRNYLFSTFRKVANSFNFEEYDAPILESEDLYKRKAGEEITQQMYNFLDKDGNALTLRPEMTPTLARMILQRMRLNVDSSTGVQSTLVLPLKWYSLPQCWRWEETQKGRKREHYQLNMDVVGVKGVSAEAELLGAMVGVFKSLGLGAMDVGIRVNSRKVLGALLLSAGVPSARFAEVCVVVDKLDKIGAVAVEEKLIHELGLEQGVAARVLQATTARSLPELRSVAGEECSEGLRELEELFTMAEAYGYSDWILLDASVVRGLAYYTGVVFEAFDRRGLLRAIAGGGRYDRLLSLYGSPVEVPCCGFGFGDCVIEELLKVN
jgi:histidyl-tRNA synthetase